MNILTQIATDFFLNKSTLIECLRTFNVSEQILEQFRQDKIYIDEDFIRRKIRSINEFSSENSFQDLFCHEDGIHLVFYVHFYEFRFIRFRLSFDIKVMAILFNSQQQTIQFMINNIKVQSSNIFLRPFLFCIEVCLISFSVDDSFHPTQLF